MTVARSTLRRTSLEKHKGEVIALLLTGMKPGEIATKYKVHPSALTKFMRRHEDRLVTLRDKVTAQVEDYAIAAKVNRVATNDLLKNLLDQVREARQNGGTGIETGLVVRTYKALGSGDNMQIVEEYSIDPALLAAVDRLHRSTAEELGQLPRPEQNVNLRAQVLIREIAGFDPEQLG